MYIAHADIVVMINFLSVVQPENKFRNLRLHYESYNTNEEMHWQQKKNQAARARHPLLSQYFIPLLVLQNPREAESQSLTG